MKKLIVALIAATAAMSAAQAQTTYTQPRPYIGLGVASIDHSYSGSGLNVTDKDGYNGNLKIFGGYELNPTWGVEAGYTDLNKADFNYNVAGVNGHGKSDGYQYYLAAKAQYPLADQFSVYGKLGAEHSQRKLRDVGAFSRSDSDTGVYAGVGLQYNFNPQMAVTAEYERYGKQKDFGAKPDAFTIGAKYSF